MYDWNGGRNRTYWLNSSADYTGCHWLQAAVTYHIFLFIILSNHAKLIEGDITPKGTVNLSIVGI